MRKFYLIMIFFIIMGFGWAGSSVDGVEYDGKAMIHYDQQGTGILYGEYFRFMEGSDGGGMGLETKLYLFRSDVGLKMLADGVLGAKFGDDGEVYYNQRGKIYRLKGIASAPELLLDDSYGDFEVLDGGVMIISKREGITRSQLLRYDLKTGHQTMLVKEEGSHFWPMVSPDGQWVYFISSMSGVYSLYRVSIHGGRVVQLTNVGEGLEVIGSTRFVPPPSEGSSMRFLSNDRLRYVSDDQLWEIDLRSGKGSVIGSKK